MNLAENLLKNITESKHHAVLVVTQDRAELGKKLRQELLSREDVVHAHVDLYYLETKVLEVDDVRKLIAWHHGFTGGEKVAIVSFHTATVYAQNAMLKIIEEARAGVRFIFLVGEQGGLLPTILSRVSLVEDSSHNDEQQKLAKQFLKTSPTERMDLKGVVTLLDSKDADDKKDREQVQQFLITLEELLQSQKLATKTKMNLRQMISYSTDTGSSPKSIVEYLALLLPVVLE